MKTNDLTSSLRMYIKPEIKTQKLQLICMAASIPTGPSVSSEKGSGDDWGGAKSSSGFNVGGSFDDDKEE